MNTARPRIGVRLVLVVLVVAASIGGGAWGAWVWRHPHAFVDAGGWEVGAGDRKVGATTYTGMSYPRDRDGGRVTLHGGQANIVSGGENAEVELLVCTLDPDAKVGAIGSSNGKNIHEYCLTLVPIEGEPLDLHYSPMRQQIVTKVTLTKPGTVTISDITLDYTFGWQRGSQRTGGSLVVSSDPVS